MDWREIDRCINYGCVIKWEDIKQRTSFNRDMVKFGWFISAYIQIEEALKHIPKRNPLPAWVPVGVLPSIVNYY